MSLLASSGPPFTKLLPFVCDPLGLPVFPPLPSFLKRLRIVYEAHTVQPRQLVESVAMHAQALRKVRIWNHHFLELLEAAV